MTSHIADELLTTVRIAEPTLRALPHDLVSTQPAPDRWTIKEVVGHLIDSAANNHQRFVRAQFTSQFTFPKYEQNEWVGSQNYRGADWQSVIDLWAAYNRHLAHVIRNASQSALTVECKIGDYDPVTLQFLMEDYVVHLKHHLRKIAERLNVAGSRLGAD